jgi:hypothetical protein
MYDNILCVLPILHTSSSRMFFALQSGCKTLCVQWATYGGNMKTFALQCIVCVRYRSVAKCIQLGRNKAGGLVLLPSATYNENCKCIAIVCAAVLQ